MLKLIPATKVDVVERCAGHGGTFGVLKETRPLANKVARPTVRSAAGFGNAHIASDCPLAAKHIVQGVRETGDGKTRKIEPEHPVQLMARAYGLIA
jgi:glycerol-3-phosphate dehydrogenase subunit C